MTANEREETISLLNFSHQPSVLSRPKGERGFISPENIWEDERVEMVGRVV
jgi:hypothetical protein